MNKRMLISDPSFYKRIIQRYQKGKKILIAFPVIFFLKNKRLFFPQKINMDLSIQLFFHKHNQYSSIVKSFQDKKQLFLHLNVEKYIQRIFMSPMVLLEMGSHRSIKSDYFQTNRILSKNSISFLTRGNQFTSFLKSSEIMEKILHDEQRNLIYTYPFTHGLEMGSHRSLKSNYFQTNRILFKNSISFLSRGNQFISFLKSSEIMGKILQEEQKNLIYKHQFTHGVEMRSYQTREVDDFQMHLHNFRITSDPIRKNILSFIKKSGTTSSHKSIAVLSGENIKTDKSIRIFNKGRIITYKKQGTFIEEQINKYLPKKISFEIKEISKKTDLYLLNRTLYKGSSDSRVGAVNKPIDIFFRKPEVHRVSTVMENKEYDLPEKFSATGIAGNFQEPVSKGDRFGELNMIADRVYRIIERRISIEKDRRGLL